MMRGPLAVLPRPTTRLSMSRMGFAWSDCHANFPLSFPGRREAASPESITPDRGYGFPGLRLRRIPGMTVLFIAPLLATSSLAALALFHAGIQRIAGGVADQVDAEDRDRQQKSRPEDQRRLDLKIGAAFGHDIAPGRRLRADAGAEEGEDGLGENGGGADIGALDVRSCCRRGEPYVEAAISPAPACPRSCGGI